LLIGCARVSTEAQNLHHHSIASPDHGLDPLLGRLAGLVLGGVLQRVAEDAADLALGFEHAGGSTWLGWKIRLCPRSRSNLDLRAGKRKTPP
jgi:hypothetical protein